MSKILCWVVMGTCFFTVVSADSVPKRIISLAPNVTEILFAIGVGDRIVGVTRFCDYPMEAKAKPSVGGFSDPSYEKIISLKPDLVIATRDGNPKSVIDVLEKRHLKVMTVNPQTIDAIAQTIRDLGQKVGATEKSETVAAEFLSRVQKIRDSQKSKRTISVFVVLSHTPLMTAGKDTFVDQLIQVSGGENIYGESGTRYPIASTEFIVKKDPEMIFCDSTICDAFKNAYEKTLRTTRAFKNHRVLSLDPAIFERPTPRLADGIERVAKEMDEIRGNPGSKAGA